MENTPFFIGAVLAGNMAGVGARTMDFVSGSYVALRVLYTVLYVRIGSQRLSYLRSLTWGALVLDSDCLDVYTVG
ncbi:hypothetical protein BDU57DRAFT_521060 [Ampelomyces quisqualis]|uniref:Uncharacterized protein n=1 Tax=Ampelomyces quisqualis TaxID=50730 RepID=A0A6A5QGX3_AMPQU|nr:hypothetical protein BDU57DRAFT_521060 [Ampelomyces quisqualis]